MKSVSRSIDRVEAIFDDETLGGRCRADRAGDADGPARPRGADQRDGAARRIGSAALRPGRKVLTLVASILAGGTHIDHADRLRAGATQKVLPFRVMAPSTLGTFLRAFTFGHVRQLDAVIAETIRRAWALGAGPGTDAVTIDLDSTICEVHGKQKHGAAYGYTREFGYHPILATRADTGEVLHARLRKGSSQRGHKRFVEELIARVRRAGATGALTVRGDSGFWSYALIDTLHRLGVRLVDHGARSARRSGRGSTPSTRPRGPRSATPTAAKPKSPRPPSPPGRASGCDRAARRAPHPAHRPRPSRAVAGLATPRLHHRPRPRPSSRSTSSTATTPPSSSPSATSKKAPGSSTAHPGGSSPTPPGSRCAVLAHNLTRWTARLGGIHPDDQLTVTRTIRTRVLALPGRLVNRSGRHVLRLPARWPWQTTFNTALDQLRALPMLSCEPPWV